MNALAETTEGHEFWTNPQGHQVPLHLVKPIDRLREVLVNPLVQDAQRMSRDLADFKERAFEEVQAFLEQSFAEFQVKPRGTKGNFSFTNYTGTQRVIVQVQDTLDFDERIGAAKELIDECITEWSDGADDKLLVLVNNAFEVDKKGKISTEKVLGLRKLDITDDKWQSAMRAINESLSIAHSKRHIRFQVRETSEAEWQTIPLDIAKL